MTGGLGGSRQGLTTMGNTHNVTMSKSKLELFKKLRHYTDIGPHDQETYGQWQAISPHGWFDGLVDLAVHFLQLLICRQCFISLF